MKNRQVLIWLLVASAACALIGVYYLVPGIYHLLTFDGSPYDSRTKHALLFFALAVLGVIGSRFVAKSGTPRKS